MFHVDGIFVLTQEGDPVGDRSQVLDCVRVDEFQTVEARGDEPGLERFGEPGLEPAGDHDGADVDVMLHLHRGRTARR